jgi:hypothetical protein
MTVWEQSFETEPATSDLTIWLAVPGIPTTTEDDAIDDLVRSWFDLVDELEMQAEAARIADVTVAEAFL